jgi:hypothetical protein
MTYFSKLVPYMLLMGGFAYLSWNIYARPIIKELIEKHRESMLHGSHSRDLDELLYGPEDLRTNMRRRFLAIFSIASGVASLVILVMSP